MSSLLKINTENYKIKKPGFVDGVFSINNYNGSSSANNNVITEMNMLSDQHMVKIKDMTVSSEHVIYDTVRGVSQELSISKDSQRNSTQGLNSFNPKGFVVGNSKNINNFQSNYVVTTFKKSEKFFDIVEYVGDGVDNRNIPHELNSEVGMVWVKGLDIYSDWLVRHKDAVGELVLNTSSPQVNNFSDIVDITKTNFKVSNNANLISIKYIAFIYAHDASYNGKIQAGSYIGGTSIITNTVSGTGKIIIPETVNTITITCRGGTGGNNIWYDPGQKYIAAIKEQPYVSAVYAWQYIDDYSIVSKNPVTVEVWNNYNHIKPAPPVVLPTKVSDITDPTSVVYVGWWTGTPEKPVFWSGHYSAYLVIKEQPFIAAVTGQAYKPPTSGGGLYIGASSTFILNEINYTFLGGEGGQAMPETKVIDLADSKNRILEYTIAKGGSLVYSYRVGGETSVTLNYALPTIKFVTNLVGTGSLQIPIEVDKVTLVCSGGVGTNDAWTDPGQPYVAPTVALDQLGLPQYPAGLPPFVQAVKGVLGQGNPTHPTGLPKYVAPRDSVAAVAQQGLPEFPYGLPVYSSSVNAVTGAGIPEYPNGLPPYTPAQPAVLEVGNSLYPLGLASWTDGGTNFDYPNGLPPYVAGKDAVVEAGLAAYPLGLPVYVAGVTGASGTGNPAYPNGLPVYVAPVAGVSSVAQQGLPEYPNGLPYYIANVTEVIGQGKALYPDGLEPFVAAKPATPGQLYIAPTSGGGDNFGEPSSIFIYNKSFSFPGSYGVIPAQEFTQYVLLSKNSVQTLEYNIPQSGKLTISYDIPNYDNTLESTFKPMYLIIKKLTNNGEWYEIDCRDKDSILKLNKSDPVIIDNLIEIKKNGFIAISDVVNETNQHYAFIAIRI